MEFFLVFSLGLAVAIVGIFVLRPGLFTRPNDDYAMLEAVIEESLSELETRQAEILAEIDEKQSALLSLQDQIIASFLPASVQSPKVMAVLELAGEGEDQIGIAKKLGLGLGEVQLILELNKDRKPLAESN
ncbi:MAG: hypothetical protein M0R49_07070 [Limnochordia bacterium]|jgi:hypothetical protein|nr:hypothetical protein [Limnochordia bacterium]